MRGLEVEGWSIEELREALGIMSECIRAADAEGVRVAALVRRCARKGVGMDRVLRHAAGGNHAADMGAD